MHKFINTKKKTIQLSKTQCKEIAKNTVNYVYFLNLIVHKELMDLSRVITNFSLNATDMPVLLTN